MNPLGNNLRSAYLKTYLWAGDTFSRVDSSISNLARRVGSATAAPFRHAFDAVVTADAVAYDYGAAGLGKVKSAAAKITNAVKRTFFQKPVESGNKGLWLTFAAFSGLSLLVGALSSRKPNASAVSTLNSTSGDVGTQEETAEWQNRLAGQAQESGLSRSR